MNYQQNVVLHQTLLDISLQNQLKLRRLRYSGISLWVSLNHKTQIPRKPKSITKIKKGSTVVRPVGMRHLPTGVCWNVFPLNVKTPIIYYTLIGSQNGNIIRLVPAQDGLFAPILWYVAKSIFRSQEWYQFALKNSNLYFYQINLIVRVFIVMYQYYKIHILFTSFEYSLYYIIFRIISFFQHYHQ